MTSVRCAACSRRPGWWRPGIERWSMPAGRQIVAGDAGDLARVAGVAEAAVRAADVVRRRAVRRRADRSRAACRVWRRGRRRRRVGVVGGRRDQREGLQRRHVGVRERPALSAASERRRLAPDAESDRGRTGRARFDRARPVILLPWPICPTERPCARRRQPKAKDCRSTKLFSALGDASALPHNEPLGGAR